MASSSSLVNGLLLLALLGAALAAAPAPQEVIPVTVYFESYCPDSVKFLTKQLYPTYLTPLAAYMNISLVPYGKANFTKSETGEYTFTCHHGEKECKGNKVIACVLKKMPFADQLKFINCTSSLIAANTKMEEYPVNECAQMTGLPLGAVQTCATEKEGSEYLAEYGNKTAELIPPLKNIPSVVFNEKFMDSENTLAVNNFRLALCSKLTGMKPAECVKSGAATLQAALPLTAAALVALLRV